MKKTGDLGEILAIEYLKKHSYEICATNFKFQTIGEIDIVAKKDEKYIFVEVKYRTSDWYGTWVESLTRQKLQKLQKTIYYYCMKNNIDLEQIQFDVISIEKWINAHRLTHFKNQPLVG